MIVVMYNITNESVIAIQWGAIIGASLVAAICDAFIRKSTNIFQLVFLIVLFIWIFMYSI